MNRGLAVLLLVTLSTTAATTRADTPPNAWDVARDPGIRTRWRTHVDARLRLDMPSTIEVRPLAEAWREGLRARLEDVNAAESPDVRLRFDLGEVYEQLDDHQRAIDTLAPALEMAPDHPAAARAWLFIAFAYAHMDRSREESHAYEMYLALETSEAARVTPMLNLAEAQMRLGRMDEAVLGYRDTLNAAMAIANRNASRDELLAVWGLTVALDRSGDPAGSAEQAAQAVLMDPREAIVGHHPDVFFVPDYERNWYLGLGRMADARRETDPKAALQDWTDAELLWQSYASQAGPKDRWFALATAHQQRAHAERLLAEKRAGSKAPPPSDDMRMFIRF